MQSEPEFLESQCADLTPYLAGDAIKDYPNLANLPSFAWPTMVFNGKIFAVPRVKGGLAGPNGTSLIVQGKAFDQAGFGSLTFANVDEFTRALKTMVDPSKGVYALGGPARVAPHWWFLQCFGAPNQWRSSGGKLTRDWETDEYKAALAYFRSLWDSGLSIRTPPRRPSRWLLRGQVPDVAELVYRLRFVVGVGRGHRSGLQAARDHPLQRRRQAKPAYFTGLGQAGRAAFKKTTPERIKEFLGIMNYFTAPFGSLEYLLLYFGVEGPELGLGRQRQSEADRPGRPGCADHQLVVPVRHAAGCALRASLGDYVKVARQAQVESYMLAVPNPIVGAYSKTRREPGHESVAANGRPRHGDRLRA